MAKKAVVDEQDELFSLLTQVSGHLEASTVEEERSINLLQETLAGVLLAEDITTVKDSGYSVEGSDLFFADAIPQQQLKRLQEITRRAVQVPTRADLRVFVRDVPVRSSQISGSVPLWAPGAAVEKTLGPFQSKDGRRLWFDFFNITKLMALYIDGRPDPVMLFKVLSHGLLGAYPHPPVFSTGKTYKLAGDTIWISSTLLAANTPAGFFTGLRISGGEIHLSTGPTQAADDKISISPSTNVSVSLDLDPAAVTDADPSSPYGPDARDAKLTLPTKLAFTFSGASHTIDSVAGTMHWNVYGHEAGFAWDKATAPRYDNVLNRVLIPFACSEKVFSVKACKSPFAACAGTADIQWAAWALPAAAIDASKPAPAAGIGGIAVQCKKGITLYWKGLRGGEVGLANPYLLCDPGSIDVTDLHAGNLYCNQEYRLWKDDIGDYGSSVRIQYSADFPLVYLTFANGNEALFAIVNANPLLDRPVKVCGERLDIRTKNSILALAVNKAFRLVYLYDDNILFDNYDPNKPKETLPKPISIALRNALFKTTPVNGLLLFGRLAEDMAKVEKASVFLTFGMYAYLPTLPDPYAANLSALRFQFRRGEDRDVLTGFHQQSILLWLVCQIRWKGAGPDSDQVDVSFHFAPLQNQFQPPPQTAASGTFRASSSLRIQADLSKHPFVKMFSPADQEQFPTASGAPGSTALPEMKLMMAATRPDYQKQWDERVSSYLHEVFALLDVSSNADQMGVSFASLGGRRLTVVETHRAADETPVSTDQFPLQVQGLDVVARSRLVRAFTLPLISWEPVINLTAKEKNGDPPFGPNYYPNDGGPTRIMNNSAQYVPIAPIPVSEFLVQSYATEPDNITGAIFTLPFGIKSLAYLYKSDTILKEKPDIQFNRPSFDDSLTGGIQLRLDAGSGFNDDEDHMFRGYTLQLNNILDMQGQKTFTGTLGEDVAKIFNQEFFESKQATMDAQRGVPLTRLDVSGYGASIFSNWLNRKAQFASTSQARFDVFVGRCAHEVIQVKSILYPWGIRVVRTITLFRVGSDYVYRFDSGWKAESDGKFDFRFDYYTDPNVDSSATPKMPYSIHPGIVKGLFNVRNIKTALADVLPFYGSMDINGFYKVDPLTNRVVQCAGGASAVSIDLQPIYFDADIELENIIQGQINNRVPGKKILGFVQLAPRGIPLTPEAFYKLLERQFGSIGGPIDCTVDIGKSGQKLRVNTVDVSNSVDKSNTSPVFAAAVRGSVILPKDGSWSMVTHSFATGDVTPLPDTQTVPLIRIGELDTDLKYPTKDLLRIANPPELLRDPLSETVNFGFLQSTGTQKALFLTPAFETRTSATLPGKLLSKTPPLFADAYRLINSKSIFPNIGDAVTGFGDAIALAKNFAESATLVDGGKKVLELMGINSADGITKLAEEGYRLLKVDELLAFDLPTTDWYLIKEDYLKVYVHYAADINNNKRDGKLDFDVNSFAGQIADKWKSRLNNLSMIVDLGPFEKLMTIKGVFDAKKGSEASYVGAGDSEFPSPQIEFSDALEKIKDILEVLAELQGGNYAEALMKGLKIAMSNSADSWEYKFEASKEIPLIKFPPGPAYDNPQAPLKLEASMKVGVYFNAALSTAALNDPKKLLPTAGASLDLYGRLSVMCVSLDAATVYAVGQVNLNIAADTKLGPSLKMKFGFGAQVVVGLPVVGDVSVLYMIGVEIYADSTKLNISAFMLFQGHADLLGGLVGVTITIEAKGTISKQSGETDCMAQVTFGLDISIFLVIDISFSESWEEQRQIA